MNATELVITAGDLQAIHEGLEAIEQAAQGMFGLEHGVLNLVMDDYKIVASYDGQWLIRISKP